MQMIVVVVVGSSIRVAAKVKAARSLVGRHVVVDVHLRRSKEALNKARRLENARPAKSSFAPRQRVDVFEVKVDVANADAFKGKGDAGGGCEVCGCLES